MLIPQKRCGVSQVSIQPRGSTVDMVCHFSPDLPGSHPVSLSEGFTNIGSRRVADSLNIHKKHLEWMEWIISWRILDTRRIHIWLVVDLPL